MARVAKETVSENNSFLTITPITNSEQSVFNDVIVENFSDTYAINTQPQVVFGRTDPIRTYSNTERTIVFGILAKSDTAAEAVTNFNNLQSIIRGSYPVYSSADRALRTPPLVRVFMAGYIEEDGNAITGYFDDIKFDYADADGYGNIPHMTRESNTLVPRFYRLNFTFHPIHAGVKGFNDAGIIDATFPYGGPLASF